MVTRNDRDRLRDLAGRCAEHAHGRSMAERREKWRRHNGLVEPTFPFYIEDNGTFFADLTPRLEYEAEEARALEGRLVHALVAYERIDDDRIIPERFVVDWSTPTTANCEELAITRADSGRGSTSRDWRGGSSC